MSYLPLVFLALHLACCVQATRTTRRHQRLLKLWQAALDRGEFDAMADYKLRSQQLLTQSKEYMAHAMTPFSLYLLTLLTPL